MTIQSNEPGILFAGQGAQQVGMGRSLVRKWPLAGDYYERADEILGWNLSGISFEGPESALTETKVCQPALFVHGIILFEILKQEGRIAAPGAVSGLSLGELTALTAAGAMDFETGLRLVAERARLMQEACENTAGGMASVIGETRESVGELCEACGLEMANLNCPGQIVISGVREGIDRAVAKGREMDFKLVKVLPVAGAYHSRLMESARVGFASHVEKADIRKPQCPFYANVSGARVDDPQKIRAGLVEQIVSPVLFEDCLRALAADSTPAVELVECGPGKILAGLVRRTDRNWTCHSFSEVADFEEGDS